MMLCCKSKSTHSTRWTNGSRDEIQNPFRIVTYMSCSLISLSNMSCVVCMCCSLCCAYAFILTTPCLGLCVGVRCDKVYGWTPRRRRVHGGVNRSGSTTLTLLVRDQVVDHRWPSLTILLNANLALDPLFLLFFYFFPSSRLSWSHYRGWLVAWYGKWYFSSSLLEYSTWDYGPIGP